jgi:competence protein ComFB
MIMKLKERYSLANLANRTEDLVFEEIERLIEAGTDMCTCEECVTDLAAWTLNHAAPRYSTSLLAPLTPDPGRERQLRVQIDLAIAAGIKKLKQHPHHG